MGEQEPIGKTYRVERVVSFERVYLVTAHSYREADDRVEREIAAERAAERIVTRTLLDK